MALLVVLFAFGALLWGAASYVSPTVLGVASAAIAVWLIGFVVRERVSRRRADR